MKVVINKCHGGFGLSDEAYEWLGNKGVAIVAYKEGGPGSYGGFVIYDNELTPAFDENGHHETHETHTAHYHKYKPDGIIGRYWDSYLEGNRDHGLLVECVEALGDKANGRCAELKVVEIPDDVKYRVEEYDGSEWIAEHHRTWS